MKLSPNEIELILLKAKKEQLNAYQASMIQNGLSNWSVQLSTIRKG
ncbi:hypothetical protein [Fictibacillus barbaricus]|uniref:Uncharacterized protein n=1 Tax=Fictibacillus barbaricus TaxID=182136 RepID=A0ABU1TWZ7_9BACL|nr:hypothetical protein [Fictibacillus barbaricus]MDR7071737.1 hypothetical protein [Fictibacillus barbaricus]